jgi:glycosyltransferase involved in cell wall biosynthesis
VDGVARDRAIRGTVTFAPSGIDARALRLALFSDTYAPQVNGVSRTLERLVHAVESRGGVVRVFTVADPEAPADPMVQRFASVPFWAYRQLRLAWPSHQRVTKALAEFRPTLVHAATEFGVGLSGRHAASALGVPFVSSYHTNFAAYAQFYRLGMLANPGWRFLRWFHSAARRTYCPTASIMHELRGAGFERTSVWSRGVDCSRFSPDHRSSEWRCRVGANDDTLVVTYVGRIAAEKGLDVAVKAVHLANAARPGRVRFVAVGDGPYEAELRRHAPEGSWMPGKLVGGALSEAYASSDVFLFPSVTDTFGNVLLEAMASGVPALGADVGPTREQLAPDRGWLLPPGDAEAFASQLVALVDDRTRVSAARERALEFARAKSWDAIWDSLIADYLALHGTRARAVTSPLPS